MSLWNSCTTDCRDSEGITIGLLDAITSIARVAVPRVKDQLENYVGSSIISLQNALDDFQQDEDVKYLVSVNFRKEISDSYEKFKESYKVVNT